MNLNESTVSNKTKIDYSELDLTKLKEFIKILQEHQIKCEKDENFGEADLTKQKIKAFKEIEKEKILELTKANHQEQMNQVLKEQELELSKFNEDWDKQFYDLAEKYSEMEIKLKMDQEKELLEKIEIYEKSLPDKYKMSTELLNKKKIYEKAVKQKEYKKAEELKEVIHEMEIQEQIKFSKERENKIRKEKEKKEQKLANEYKLFNDKITLIYSELKTNRQIEYDKMIQRHKCVVKELEANQKLEISNLDKITKGISRPNSRILTLVKSASVINNTNTKAN